MTETVRYHLGQFPPGAEVLDWERLVPFIGPANAALARYDGLITAIPNADVLLSPLTTHEAVLSSKIEGTNVTMGEVLEVEAGADGEVDQPKRDDVEEVLNYRIALGFASNALRTGRSLTLHLLREVHSLLLQGVRGRDKNPGAFRDEQNWIGSRGCSLNEASFVPIPQEHLQSGLDAWVGYADTQQLDPLVQLAILHLEFESIHPFKDGNGRLGRMIIPLFLVQRGVLSRPGFYMSGYLEERRGEYIESMRSVSRDGAWTDWCIFFLEGVIDQARQNQQKAQSILNLYQQMQHNVTDITHSQHSGLAVEFLFSRPIFSTTVFVQRAGIPRATALRILQILRDEGVLKTVREGAGRRAAIYAFPGLLNIAEGRNVF